MTKKRLNILDSYSIPTSFSNFKIGIIKTASILLLIGMILPGLFGAPIEEDYRNDLDAVIERTRMMLQTSNKKAVAEWVTRVVDDRLLNSNSEEIFSSGIGAIFNVITAPSKFVWRSRGISNMRSHPDYDDYEGMAALAWENQLGNCGENSYVTYYILKKAGAEGHVRILESGEDGAHSFTVWDMPPDAIINDPTTWGDGLVVDPWLGEVLTAEEAQDHRWIKNDDDEVPIRDATADHDEEAESWNTIWREEMKRKGQPYNRNPDPDNTEITDCFIATAVYGTPSHANIQLLRSYRDQKLRKHFLGRLFISGYETFGPFAAYCIRHQETRKKWVRNHIVEPAVRWADQEQNQK